MSEIEPAKRNRSRLILIGLAALFVVPILLANYLNRTWSEWAPEVTKNSGDLVQPVLPLPGRDPAEWQRDAEGRWTLLAVRTDCDQDCLELMGLVFNVHRAMGHRADRVQRVLVLPAAPAEPLSIPRLMLSVDVDLAAALEQELGGPASLYMVDPLGNVMMRYSDGFDAGGLQDDLERLLKYSKVGT
jgi:hypothetical protein